MKSSQNLDKTDFKPTRLPEQPMATYTLSNYYVTATSQYPPPQWRLSHIAA